MTEPNQNMAIWDAVSKTDPDFTKKVTQRGGFTSVNANYQIKMATEQFGPLGVGWGYSAGEPIFNGSFIMIPVTLWHGDRSNTFGPTFGCCEMLGNRPDSDAPKKAGTDALTKLLSQLGFNADIFLGQYDDNKYVEELRREKANANAPKPEPKKEKTPATVRDYLQAQTLKANTTAALETWWERKDITALQAELPEPMQNEVRKSYTDRMAALLKAPTGDESETGHTYK